MSSPARAGTGKKLLLAAHADELCYLVRAIDPGGFLWLANGQAWERTTSVRNWFTVGQRVRVLARSGPLPGVIASTTGHLASFALGEPKELTWNDFWVDTGQTRDELLARGVTPGTRVIWDATTEQFGPHVVGKALDDRVPLAVITEVLRRVPTEELGCELTLACTIQEEIGLIGAFGLAAREQFDAGIAVEIGLASDIPGVEERAIPVRLGGGPLLVHKDALVHYDHALTAALERTAAHGGHPDPARRLRLLRQRWRGLHEGGHPRRDGRLPRPLHAQPLRDRPLGRHRSPRHLALRLRPRRDEMSTMKEEIEETLKARRYAVVGQPSCRRPPSLQVRETNTKHDARYKAALRVSSVNIRSPPMPMAISQGATIIVGSAISITQRGMIPTRTRGLRLGRQPSRRDERIDHSSLHGPTTPRVESVEATWLAAFISRWRSRHT